MDRTGPNWKNKEHILEPSFNWVVNMVLKHCGMILLRGTVVHTSPCSWHVFFFNIKQRFHILFDIYWHVGSGARVLGGSHFSCLILTCQALALECLCLSKGMQRIFPFQWGDEHTAAIWEGNQDFDSRVLSCLNCFPHFIMCLF